MFLLFKFSIYKTVDIMDVYKSLNISIGTVMKNPEMLKLVLDYLKTKIMCKCAARKLPYLLYKFTLFKFLVNIRLNKCVIKLFQKMVEH